MMYFAFDTGKIHLDIKAKAECVYVGVTGGHAVSVCV